MRFLWIIIIVPSLLWAIEYNYPEDYIDLFYESGEKGIEEEYTAGIFYRANVLRECVEYKANYAYGLFYQRSDIINPFYIFKGFFNYKHIFGGAYKLRIANGGLLGYKSFIPHSLNIGINGNYNVKPDMSLYENYKLVGTGLIFDNFILSLFDNTYMIYQSDSLIKIDEDEYIYEDTPDTRDHIKERGLYAGLKYKLVGAGVLYSHFYNDTIDMKYTGYHLYFYNSNTVNEIVKDSLFSFYSLSKIKLKYLTLKFGGFYDIRNSILPYIHSNPLFFEYKGYGGFIGITGKKYLPYITMWLYDSGIWGFSLGGKYKYLRYGLKGYSNYLSLKLYFDTKKYDFSAVCSFKDSTVSYGITIRTSTDLHFAVIKEGISLFDATGLNRYYLSVYDQFSSYMVTSFSKKGIYGEVYFRLKRFVPLVLSGNISYYNDNTYSYSWGIGIDM